MLGRIAIATASVSAIGLLVVVVDACLPDLGPPTPEDEVFEASVSACGDGVIDSLEDGGDAGESCDPGAVDASTPGCTSCQFSCPEGQIDETGHCYFKLGPTDSFVAATSACAARGAHVVTFASDREVAFVSQLGATNAWVGLEYRGSLGGYVPVSGVNEPGWSASCEGCFLKGALEAGTPPVSCLATASDTAASWLRVDCKSAHETICEREPSGQRAQFCPGPALCATLPPTYGKKRYVIPIITATAKEADQYCKDSFTNGQLVVLESAEEREQLVKEIVPRAFPAPITVWVGLSFDGGAWTWDDGVARDIAWGEGQPSGAGDGRAFLNILPTNAPKVDTQLVYSSDGTSAKRAFICQRR